MKVSRILYLIAIIFSSFPLLAQEEEDEDNDIFAVRKNAHCFYSDDTGNIIEIPLKECLDAWASKHIDYSRKAIKKGTQSEVTITFEIDKKGILSIEKAEGDPILEKAAREVFGGFPQLAPAEQRGKPVVTFYQYPISFRKD